MNFSIRWTLFIPVLVAMTAAIGSVLTRWLRGFPRLAHDRVIICTLPSLLMLGLFYSLALHMYRSLGQWPTSIGERGFPPALLVHANVAVRYFGGLLLTTLFVWPVVFLVCLLVRPWRRWTAYLGIHALSVVVCIGLMLLAPSPFLNWWWD